MKQKTIPSCHPSERHYAKGLCLNCYNRARWGRNPEIHKKALKRIRRYLREVYTKRPIDRAAITEKRCCGCRKIKPPILFYESDYHKDGFSPSCKDCRKQYESDRRQEKKKELNLKRKETIIKDPIKHNARRGLEMAVRNGTIIKPPCCSSCERSTQKDLLHGHHEDYSKPLEVDWFCPRCHGIRHRHGRLALKEKP